MRSRWVSYLHELYCYHLSHRESNISSSTWTQHPSEWGKQALMHETAPLPCLDACVCITLNALLCCSGCILPPLCHYVVVYSAPAHTASGRTQSLHLKKLSSSVFPVRVESQLQSNKVSRTARRPQGGFWVLKNARREKKVFSFARTPDARKQW